MQLIFLNFLAATFIWITLEASTPSEYSKCARIPPGNKVEIQSVAAFAGADPQHISTGLGVTLALMTNIWPKMKIWSVWREWANKHISLVFYNVRVCNCYECFQCWEGLDREYRDVRVQLLQTDPGQWHLHFHSAVFQQYVFVFLLLLK